MQSFLDIEFLRRTQLYRPGRKEIDDYFSSRRWTNSIDCLLAAGYSFFPCRYEEDGYLFRGMQSGLRQAAVNSSFGHFDGDDEMSRVEKAMDVYFLTSEISDAVTVSLLHESADDAAIIAVRASLFNEHLDRHEAAVLAVGDGGVVFRYPFLTAPVPGSAVESILAVSSLKTAELPEEFRERCILAGGTTRRELEFNMNEQMEQRGIRPAAAIRTRHYPKHNE